MQKERSESDVKSEIAYITTVQAQLLQTTHLQNFHHSSSSSPQASPNACVLAHTQTSLLAARPIWQVRNSEHASKSTLPALARLWQLLVRAYHEHGCIWHQKSAWLGFGRSPGYGSRCEACVYLWYDTLVQYAACLAQTLVARHSGWSSGYHSIPIILGDASPSFIIHELESSLVVEKEGMRRDMATDMD